MTSEAMRTRPTTLTCSISPAARAASRLATLARAGRPRSVCRSIERDTSADWLFSWLRIAVLMKVRPVREEPLLNQQIDPSEIDVAEIDGDLLAVGNPLPAAAPFSDISHSPSVWMVYGGRAAGFKRRAELSRSSHGRAAAASRR